MPSGTGARIVCVVLAVAGVCTAAGPPVHAQKADPIVVAARRAEFQTVLDAYVAGDREAVAREMRGRSIAEPATRLALNALLADPAAASQTARAAFALELIVSGYRAGRAPDPGLLTLGRALVLGRPASLGQNAAEDRFEVLWHQIALGILQGRGQAGPHTEYLTAIGSRSLEMARLTPPLANRFALARAIDAVQCCLQMALLSQNILTAARIKPPIAKAEDAIALFEAAADDPALRAEALVRGAYLEQRLGRPLQALARLDRASPVADTTIAYAAAIIRGGIHDQQGQPAAAADAYQAAQNLAPNAQVPAIGRAAALQRAGRTDDAVAEAVAARRLPVNGFDPWPVFLRADARFIDGWLRELRALVK